MFRKAVVCTDLTSASDCLVECAGNLHLLGVREVVLAHVADAFADSAAGLMRSGVDNAFARQLASLEDCDFSVRVDATLAHPAFSLRDLVDRHQASLVVLAPDSSDACGGSLVRRGGTRVVATVDTPVFIASSRAVGAETGRSCERMLQHVLFATDLGKVSEAAFEVVRGLAALGATTITLLHVRRSSPSEGNGGGSREAEQLDAMKQELVAHGARLVHAIVETGSPVDVIGARVAGMEHSLAVMGTPDQRVAAEHVDDHVSEYVVKEARCPVLLVPAASMRRPEMA